MIQCVFEDEENLDIFAEEQCQDEETLEQLKNEYSIYFMTDGGDAAMPVLVRDGSVIIGGEDDGHIFFHKQYGQFIVCAGKSFVPALIKDLESAIRV